MNQENSGMKVEMQGWSAVDIFYLSAMMLPSSQNMPFTRHNSFDDSVKTDVTNSTQLSLTTYMGKFRRLSLTFQYIF